MKIRSSQARKLLDAEEEVRNLCHELKSARAHRDRLRTPLLDGLVAACATGPIVVGGVEIKVTQDKEVEIFDFTGFRERYKVTKYMRQFIKTRKQTYTWTVQEAPGQ